VSRNPYMAELDWHGLYTGQTSADPALFRRVRKVRKSEAQASLLDVEPENLLDSTKHPAKMSLALTHAIIRQMMAWGWLTPGALVVDPFGGRGTTAAVWCGLDPRNRCVTIEIEPHFVEFQQQNREYASQQLGRPLLWEIVHGDSRKADEHLRERGVGVTSPPYSQSEIIATPYSIGKRWKEEGRPAIEGEAGNKRNRRYGHSAGQIAQFPDVSISSPPYSGHTGRDHTRDEDDEGRKSAAQARTGERCGEGSVFRDSEGYGNTPGQIGQLPDPNDFPVGVGSPPFAGMNITSQTNIQSHKKPDGTSVLSGVVGDGYGTSPGQIGAMPDPVGISSPPYGRGVIGQTNVERLRELTRTPGSSLEGRNPEGAWFEAMAAGYVNSPGNIDNLPDGPVGLGSPPWGGSLGATDPGFITPGEREKYVHEKSNLTEYGGTPGQIGSMPDPVGLMSPPYGEAQQRAAAGNVAPGEVADCITRAYDGSVHGQQPGQIGNLPDVAGISSPPYEDALKAAKNGIDMSRSKRLASGRRDTGASSQVDYHCYSEAPPAAVTSPPFEPGRSEPNYSPERLERAAGPVTERLQAYAGARQEGYAAISSPPYEDSLNSDDPEKRGGLFRDPKRRDDPGLTGQYSADAGVSSPPYEAQSGGTNATGGHIDERLIERHAAGNAATGYAENCDGQIGNTQGETYASACYEVYAALARAGVRFLALVTKNPTRSPSVRWCACWMKTPDGERAAALREEAKAVRDRMLPKPAKDDPGRDRKRAEADEHNAPLRREADRLSSQAGELQWAAIEATETARTCIIDGNRFLVCAGCDRPLKPRGGVLRRLDKLTCQLLRAAGYRVVAVRRAWLFESEAQRLERERQSSMFLNEVGQSGRVHGRLSFFARLHHQKGGVRAQHEDVIFCELAAPSPTAPAVESDPS
jgi:hypothetical protein